MMGHMFYGGVMDNIKNKGKDLQIEIKVDDSVAVGAYANYTNISHSGEEFVMDFLFIHPTPPPGFGKLVSRVLLSPGHAKRLLLALSENIEKYESRFGRINIGIEQSPDNIQ